jgi:hypothetical protein
MTTNPATKTNGFQPGNPGGGAPRGNSNALRIGVRSDAVRNVKLGALPDKRIERDCNRFRRVVEQWVLDRYGEIRPTHELAINSAVRHEVVCRMALRYLKMHDATLGPTEKLNYLSLMAKHSDARDKAVERLGLDANAASDILTLYGPQPDAMQLDATENAKAGNEQ